MIDAKRAADKVWAKIMRSGAPRIVFIDYDGRVLTVARDAQGFSKPAHRVVGVFNEAATVEELIDAIEATAADLSRRGLEKQR